MDEVDTFGITLPVPIWRKLFELSGKADRTPSDYLRTLLQREASREFDKPKMPTPADHNCEPIFA